MTIDASSIMMRVPFQEKFAMMIFKNPRRLAAVSSGMLCIGCAANLPPWIFGGGVSEFAFEEPT